jgi:hypothetical protein
MSPPPLTRRYTKDRPRFTEQTEVIPYSRSPYTLHTLNPKREFKHETPDPKPSTPKP